MWPPSFACTGGNPPRRQARNDPNFSRRLGPSSPHSAPNWLPCTSRRHTELAPDHRVLSRDGPARPRMPDAAVRGAVPGASPTLTAH